VQWQKAMTERWAYFWKPNYNSIILLFRYCCPRFVMFLVLLLMSS